EGSRISHRLSRRDGRGNPAALELARRDRRHRRGAATLLRRHDAGARAAVLPARARAALARTVSRAVSVAVSHRDSKRGARGDSIGAGAVCLGAELAREAVGSVRAVWRAPAGGGDPRPCGAVTRAGEARWIG